MSWLLAAFVPGFLMLATFGLERVESSLRRDTVTETDIAAFLEQVTAGDISALTRERLPEAPELLRRRQAEPLDDFPEHRPVEIERRADPLSPRVVDEPGLPTRGYGQSRSNTQFHGTRHPNRV